MDNNTVHTEAREWLNRLMGEHHLSLPIPVYNELVAKLGGMPAVTGTIYQCTGCGRAQARAEMRAEMQPVAKVVSTVDADGDASLRAAWLGTPPERGVLLAVIPNKD